MSARTLSLIELTHDDAVQEFWNGNVVQVTDTKRNLLGDTTQQSLEECIKAILHQGAHLREELRYFILQSDEPRLWGSICNPAKVERKKSRFYTHILIAAFAVIATFLLGRLSVI